MSVQLSANGSVEHVRDTSKWCLGLDGRWRPSRRFDTAQRDRKIVLLRSARKSIRAIATEVDCSVGTVHRVLSQWEVVE